MMLLAQSKLKDAENIYMRYLYDKHKHDLPKGTVEHKNVSSSDEAESKWLFNWKFSSDFGYYWKLK